MPAQFSAKVKIRRDLNSARKRSLKYKKKHQVKKSSIKKIATSQESDALKAYYGECNEPVESCEALWNKCELYYKREVAKVAFDVIENETKAQSTCEK